METDSLRTTLLILGWIGAIGYVLIGLVGGLWLGRWGDATGNDGLLWYLSLVGGGIVLLIGLWLLSGVPLAGATLVAAGAVAGGLAIFWSVIGPVFAGVVLVLCVLYVLHRSAGRHGRLPAG